VRNIREFDFLLARWLIYYSRGEFPTSLRERWRGGETVQSLARHVQYPPYLMARLILEGLYNFSAKRVKELVRDPALIDNER
jgi:hypothetical protein